MCLCMLDGVEPGGSFSTECYVRAFQTFETWYWPLFPEGWVKKYETGKASSQYLISLYEE